MEQIAHGEEKALRRADSEGPGSFVRFAAVYAVICSIGATALFFTRPTIFLSVPSTLLLFFTVSTAVTLACIGQWYVHQHFSSHDFVQHNEVGGFIIAVAGTVYAVVLGFVTVVAWQHFADARQIVALEAAASADAWHAAMGIPEARRARVRRDTLNYATLMRDDEWRKMREGRFDTTADFVVMDAMSAAGTFVPANLMQSNSQAATLQQLNTLHDLRQRRLAENNGGICSFEWLVLLLGAVSIICFCWLFGLVNRAVHLLMTGAVTLLISSILVLLFELQYPFRTDLRIEPISWTGAVDHIKMMQAGPQKEMRM